MTELRKRVGVYPASAAADRPRLLAALEAAFAVRMVGVGSASAAELDALLVLPVAGATPAAAEDPGIPVLRALAPERPQPGPDAAVALAAGAPVDRPLRGITLTERHLPAGTTPLRAERGDAVLATGPDGPLWVARDTDGCARHEVAVASAELADDEVLRHRLDAGRALGLLAIVHFLRELTAESAWTPPPPRAAFIIDDPNLHWTSYGFIGYEQLARHATAHGYHAAMAMVPLDAWLVRPAAARIFKANAGALSLLVHGNDHVNAELERPAARPGRTAQIAQALRRVAAFEQRSGVPVSRVMAAPHGRCSEAAARSMLQLGFEALSITRPYPWLARPPASWLAHPPGAGPLVGWEPADMVAGGLPILLRRDLVARPDDLALRAYLGQPMILSGHHDELADGGEMLAEGARVINALGDVRWGSLADLAAASVCTRRRGETLEVRLHSRRTVVEVPEGVTRIVPSLPPFHPEPERERVGTGGGETSEAGAEIAARGSRVELRLERTDALDPRAVDAPRLRSWPVMRRALAEGRDRVAPLLARAG